MASIFPPSAQGGVPPAPSVINGYTPQNPVVGSEGPLYADSGCTTVFTAEQINAITSELLAAVDYLNISFDSTRIDNLGRALASMPVVPLGGLPGQALVTNSGGAPQWGAPIDGGNF